MKQLAVRNLGPIRCADVEIGDLTVLVGPQASGKSLFLQFLKLVSDAGTIKSELKTENLWSKSWPDFLAAYLGTGMESVWDKTTEIHVDGERWGESKWDRARKTDAKVYYIPAQRLVAVENSWPKPFRTFDNSYPYVVRSFSEQLRLFVERVYAAGGRLLFPVDNRFKADIRQVIERDVFRGGRLVVRQRGQSKSLVLDMGKRKQIAVGSWSSGQREFMPLLLQMSILLPGAGKTRAKKFETIVIEEPEMGLHPVAFSGPVLLALEALSRGYRVVLSTHSASMLDVVWALHEIKETKGEPSDLLEVVGLGSGARADTLSMAKACLKKVLRVYYFEPRLRYGRYATEGRDISRLDPGSEDRAEQTWGGLTEFSSAATNVVARLRAGEVGR